MTSPSAGWPGLKAEEFDNGLQLTRICKSLKPMPILLLTGWGILLLSAVDAFRV